MSSGVGSFSGSFFTENPRNVLIAAAAVSATIIGVSRLFSQPSHPACPAAIPGRVRRLRDALFAKAGGAPSHSANKSMMPTVPAPELREIGSVDSATGERQSMDKRLYMQMRVLDVSNSAGASVTEFVALLSELLQQRLETDRVSNEGGVAPSTSEENGYILYLDAASSTGVGLLSWSISPSYFIDVVNAVLSDPSLITLFTERTGWTMFGKTYSNGHEKDLEEYLVKKPIRTCVKPENEWAVWYPLRRVGTFYVQPPSDQCQMLLTHAAIGKSFADVQAAQDVRLKCFGMDPQDNEYMIGIIGRELHPLSRVVEEMRKTKHTAEYIEKLGPFFVGRRVPAVIREL